MSFQSGSSSRYLPKPLVKSTRARSCSLPPSLSQQPRSAGTVSPRRIDLFPPGVPFRVVQIPFTFVVLGTMLGSHSIEDLIRALTHYFKPLALPPSRRSSQIIFDFRHHAHTHRWLEETWKWALLSWVIVVNSSGYAREQFLCDIGNQYYLLEDVVFKRKRLRTLPIEESYSPYFPAFHCSLISEV